MKVTPKPNIQQSQSKIVNRIRTFFFKGKVKLKTLLCDVFEKKTVESSKQLKKEGNEWLKDLIPADAYDPNIKVEYTPPWITTDADIASMRFYTPRYLNKEDKDLLLSIKDEHLRNELFEKFLKEGRIVYEESPKN